MDLKNFTTQQLQYLKNCTVNEIIKELESRNNTINLFDCFINNTDKNTEVYKIIDFDKNNENLAIAQMIKFCPKRTFVYNNITVYLPTIKSFKRLDRFKFTLMWGIATELK